MVPSFAAFLLGSSKVMGLFKPDLYRSFAIGFALGAVVVFGVLGANVGSIANGVAPAAEAAPAR